MGSPKVSVIIPAYNQADYLAGAIQSVLNQTYSNFEIIIVNDASPDRTNEVVKQFDDPRLACIVHEKNRMLPAARNTGIRASTGEIIALLDADDLFHPEKLRAHVEFLDKHPEVGVTYNARFGIYHSAKDIFELWRPSLVVGLSDLVMGFPFAPSDMVVRRDWMFRVGLFDESYTAFSEDLDINCRLALAGCQFASVNRTLNYRRFHQGRVIKNLASRLEAALRALDTVFSDSRCPKDVLALRDVAYAEHYLVWAYQALSQNETSLGQTCIREAARLNSTILNGCPCELVNLFLYHSIADESLDHAIHLRKLFVQLPPEFASLLDQLDWAVAQGYLLKAARVILWDRTENVHVYFDQFTKLGMKIIEPYIQQLAYQLLNYEMEFGRDATQSILQRLEPYLKQVGNGRIINSLRGCYAANSAFQSYRSGEHGKVPGRVMNAIANEPKYMTNRGILSILLRSLGMLAR